MKEPIKTYIEVLEDIKYQFESSIDDSECDVDAKEALESNKKAVEALEYAINELRRKEIEK